jgi:hypothetical protein
MLDAPEGSSQHCVVQDNMRAIEYHSCWGRKGNMVLRRENWTTEEQDVVGKGHDLLALYTKSSSLLIRGAQAKNPSEILRKAGEMEIGHHT